MRGGIVFHLLREAKTVDPAKLRTIISDDATARNHYQQNQMADCAARVNAIAPPIPKPCPLSRMGVLSLHAATPHHGQTLLEKLDAAAQSNRLIAEIVAFMGPGNLGSYPDFSLQPIRDALVAPIEIGGVGATPFEYGPILEAGVQPDQTTPAEIAHLKEREQWQPTYAAS